MPVALYSGGQGASARSEYQPQPDYSNEGAGVSSCRPEMRLIPVCQGPSSVHAGDLASPVERRRAATVNVPPASAILPLLSSVCGARIVLLRTGGVMQHCLSVGEHGMWLWCLWGFPRWALRSGTSIADAPKSVMPVGHGTAALRRPLVGSTVSGRCRPRCQVDQPRAPARLGGLTAAPPTDFLDVCRLSCLWSGRCIGAPGGSLTRSRRGYVVSAWCVGWCMQRLIPPDSGASTP